MPPHDGGYPQEMLRFAFVGGLAVSASRPVALRTDLAVGVPLSEGTPEGTSVAAYSPIIGRPAEKKSVRQSCIADVRVLGEAGFRYAGCYCGKMKKNSLHRTVVGKTTDGHFIPS